MSRRAAERRTQHAVMAVHDEEIAGRILPPEMRARDCETDPVFVITRNFPTRSNAGFGTARRPRDLANHDRDLQEFFLADLPQFDGKGDPCRA